MTQQSELFEQAEESVMTRTLEGMIEFWNRSAEKLYGWGKEEAVGKVSHDLLRTQFPKPLKEIEAEVARNGVWEGCLVHTTRDGRRVVVQSRWALNPTGELVEINTPSTDRGLGAGGGGNIHSVQIGNNKINAADRRGKIVNFVLAGGAFLYIIALLVYGLLAHDLIKAIHDGAFLGIGNWLMPGQATTPLENYYKEADARFVGWMIWLPALFLVALVLIKKPVGIVLGALSLLGTSFLFFCLIETFPALIKPLHLDFIGYYSFKAYYIPDEVLGWRGKPFTGSTAYNFRGAKYSPLYGIEVPPITIHWTNDENGFRNRTTTKFADIVVTGDSFMEAGDTDSDTFAERLQQHMDGLTVANLGEGGYGPFQYLEVLKRYGLEKRPKYALFAFYAGNDIGDIKAYSDWKSGRPSGMHNLVAMIEASFWQRYFYMLGDLLKKVKTIIWTQACLLFDKTGVTGGYPYVYPEIAILSMKNNKQESMLFIDLNDTQPTEQMLKSKEWQDLKRILSEFRNLCESNGVQPILVYVPAPTEIYAKYSTDQSGTGWRWIRDEQIAASKNRETAFVRLAQELDIDLINLIPIFEDAAERGEVLYYSLDVHWNAAGRELAAATVAHVIATQSDGVKLNNSQNNRGVQ